MEKLILFLIMIGIFNVLSRIMDKKLNQRKPQKPGEKKTRFKTKSLPEKKAEPSFTEKAQEGIASLGDILSDLRGSAGETRRYKEELKQQPFIMPFPEETKQKPPKVKPQKPAEPPQEKTGKRLVVKEVPGKPQVSKKPEFSLNFSPHPLVNGIIWSEVLTKPTRRGRKR